MLYPCRFVFFLVLVRLRVLLQHELFDEFRPVVEVPIPHLDFPAVFQYEISVVVAAVRRADVDDFSSVCHFGSFLMLVWLIYIYYTSSVRSAGGSVFLPVDLEERGTYTGRGG